MISPDRPQLRMRHRLEAVAGTMDLPAGYACRAAVREDASALDRLLLQAFGEGWREGQAIPELLDNANVPTTWVVQVNGRLVATASYQLKPEEFPESAWVHYVAADPTQSGRGLGAYVTWKVLEQAVHSGRKDAYLTTDDFRLPAIATYLKLGFEPDCWHESHADRWQSIFESLRGSRRD